MKNESYLKLTSIIYRSFQHIQRVISKDVSAYGLNDAEFGAMEVLYHKGRLPIIQVGHLMLMGNSSMNYVITKLKDKDYILESIDPKDRRNKLIELSKKGYQYFEQIFEDHKKTLEEIYRVLEPSEIEDLMKTLKKLGYHAKSIERI